MTVVTQIEIEKDLQTDKLVLLRLNFGKSSFINTSTGKTVSVTGIERLGNAFIFNSVHFTASL